MGEHDQVGLLGRLDRFSLHGFSNHAQRGGGDSGLLANGGCEWNLITGANGNFRVGGVAAAGSIDYIDARRFEAASQFDGLFEVPTTFLPVRGGDAKE